MATKDDMMRAAKAFWRPQKAGTDIHIADIKIRVVSKDVGVDQEDYRTIALKGRLIAGYWETQDIRLLQLCGPNKRTHESNGPPIAELLYWIVAEVRSPTSWDSPQSITDLITVEYDEKTERAWLLGELYDDRVAIRSEWEPEPFRIGEDGLHARWMDGHETWLELSAEPMEEYDRVFRRPIEAEEVLEIPTVATKLETLQKAVDDIERDIRQLRTKERDFTSSNIEMAKRLGKLNEYEELLRQRDEHMWRGNPEHSEEDTFDVIVKLDSYDQEQSSIKVQGPQGDYTYLLIPVRSGFVRNDEIAYGYNNEQDAFQAAVTQLTEIGCYFSEQGAPRQFKPGGRSFDMVVRLDETHDEATSVQVDTAFGATVFAIFSVREGWVDNFLTDYGYLSEQQAVKVATKPVYSSIGAESITAEVSEMPIEETPITSIQEHIDDIEREIRVLRSKERDFTSPNIEVAHRLGKRAEYERLLKERDEAMWRENPCARIKRAL